MINKQRKTNGFTLIELLVAIGILAMVLSFASVIFRVSIDAYRTAIANAEIMQKLRAITNQLNADFKGLQKDGYLVQHCELLNRKEYEDFDPYDFRADRIYYFCTGDFQSWFNTDIRSNIAQVYFGHDSISLTTELVSRWKLSRDVTLITPDITFPDCYPTSYAQLKADPSATLADAKSLLDLGVPIDIQSDPNHIRRLMSQNVGEIKIEWTDNTRVPDGSLAWFGLNNTLGTEPWPKKVEDTADPPRFYRAFWEPLTPEEYWPKALKFTFMLYDSKGIIKEGRTFTHIVYLGN